MLWQVSILYGELTAHRSRPSPIVPRSIACIRGHAQLAWPHVQRGSAVAPACWQCSLQYLPHAPLVGAEHLQPGCAHVMELPSVGSWSISHAENGVQHPDSPRALLKCEPELRGFVRSRQLGRQPPGDPESRKHWQPEADTTEEEG